MSFEYDKITLEDMMAYIEEHEPEFKDTFKEAALITYKPTLDKRYNYMRARKAFCEHFMPEIMPTKNKKPTKTEILLKW